MRTRVVSSLVLACCLLLPSAHARAAEGASISTPAGAVGVNHGPGGMGFPVGKFAAVLNYRYCVKDQWYKDSSGEDGADVKQIVHTPVLKTRFSFAKGWDVRTATPFLDMTVDREDIGLDDKWVGGLGDTTAILRYQILSQKTGAPLNLAADLGVVIPTGEIGDNNPGNGAWGALFGFGATYMSGSHRIEGDTSYTVYSEGTAEKTKGDRLRINAHYAYALNSLLDLGVEAYYEWTQEDEQYGVDLVNDAKSLYVGPKFNLKFPEYGITFGGNILMAAYRDYETATLTDDWRTEFKLIKLF
ncbi:Uncharacterized conserved protein [Desulfomicrobium apsheronum]|uniref:Uncharacterized conserved protein n=1 Tax=Desulfomicrobium apsheronum TaxID=52560 RepID=A0A1I4ABN0_9BACT|nr:transporter [Desulfomicrobium apsheronum]SFK53703.1 Uncharacterized conserved protein [Desulfomicrobium apsheronum]